MIIVALIGLKKCGKTTTAEALIREFKHRGYRVGGVKYMPHATFTIDVKGKDTWRQKEAGADFVISLSREEVAYVEPLGREGGERNRSEEESQRSALMNVLRLVPGDTDILICEGLTEDDPRILRVVLARSPELLRETFEVRGVRDSLVDPGRETRGKMEGKSGEVMRGEARNEMGGDQGEDRGEGNWDERGAAPGERAGWNIEDGTKIVGTNARVIAFSGIMANEVDRVPGFPEIRVFNCTTQEGVKGLADHILSFKD